jgi:hypothetical protein
MGNASSDRTRMRHDLRELAKLASPTEASATPSQGHGFETADSSGYVDLSAFSATDDKWIERELARAGGRAQGGAVLTPGSMAPVAMTALLDAEGEAPVSGKRGRVYWALAIGGVAAVAALAIVLARHRPAATTVASQAQTTAAAAPAPPPVATPAPAAAIPDAPQAVASTSAAPAVTVSAPEPSPASRKHAARTHGARSAPTPAPASHAAVATRTASVPPSKSAGGDSLMDMMRASINGSKK